MKGKKLKARGTTLRQYLHGEMKDPEFRRLYAEADIELRVALEIPLKSADEPRTILIGLISGKHWSAIITYRKERIRIISVR